MFRENVEQVIKNNNRIYHFWPNFLLKQEVVGITLGIDSNKITCHVKRLGGGFGGKVMKIASLSAIAATAALK